MGKDINSVRVGRSNIKYAGRDVGFSEGEITITYTQEFRDFEPDQNTGVVKDFLVKEAVEVVIPMAQWRARDLALAKVMAAGELKATAAGGGGSTTIATAALVPGATSMEVAAVTNFDAGDKILVGTGPKAEIVEVLSTSPTPPTITLASTTPIQFDHAIGEAVVEIDIDKTRIAVGNQIANIPDGQLDIEPLDGGETIRIYKAKVKGEIEMTLQKAEETVIEVSFRGLMETTRADGDQLFSVGDQTVT